MVACRLSTYQQDCSQLLQLTVQCGTCTHSDIINRVGRTLCTGQVQDMKVSVFLQQSWEMLPLQHGRQP